jgi:hypothetical protein
MSSTANRYFDWYLDGKRDASPPPGDTKSDKKNVAKEKEGPAKKAGPTDEQIFEKRDRNKDNAVTWEEFIDGRTENMDVLRKNFERRDTNNNDLWEKSEIE